MSSGSVPQGNLTIHSSPPYEIWTLGLAPPLEPPKAYNASKSASLDPLSNILAALLANSSKDRAPGSRLSRELGSYSNAPRPFRSMMDSFRSGDSLSKSRPFLANALLSKSSPQPSGKESQKTPYKPPKNGFPPLYMRLERGKDRGEMEKPFLIHSSSY